MTGPPRRRGTPSGGLKERFGSARDTFAVRGAAARRFVQPTMCLGGLSATYSRSEPQTHAVESICHGSCKGRHGFGPAVTGLGCCRVAFRISDSRCRFRFPCLGCQRSVMVTRWQAHRVFALWEYLDSRLKRRCSYSALVVKWVSTSIPLGRLTVRRSHSLWERNPRGRFAKVRGKLALIDTETGAERVLELPHLTAGTPAWSNDGSKIFCALHVPNQGALLHSVDPKSGVTNPLHTRPQRNLAGPWVETSANEESILFCRATGRIAASLVASRPTRWIHCPTPPHPLPTRRHRSARWSQRLANRRFNLFRRRNQWPWELRTVPSALQRR